MEQDLSICSRYLEPNCDQNTNFTRDFKATGLRIGIIGAGIAGLRCAEILIEHGMDVTILEARDRLGGRIHQATFLDRSMDMGPSWVHGTDNNILLDLAKETGSHLASPSEDANVYDARGKLVDHQQVMESFDLIWEILAEAFRYSNADCEHIPPDTSLKDFFKDNLAARQLDTPKQAFILELAEIWGAFVGDAFEKQSLKWFWLEECLDGDNLFVSNTHQAIIDKIAKPVKEKAQLHISTVAKNVYAQPKETREQKILVETTRGTFEFDELVVTIPLGCLKNETLTFQPELPPKIRSAIAGASYSGLEKAYIVFPAAFWENEIQTAGESNEECSPSGTSCPTYSHFLRSTIVPERQQSWTLEMVVLSSSEVFGVHAQPVLLFELWDTAAAQVASAVSVLEPSSREYHQTIIEFFEPFYSQLPGYQEGHPNCIPIAALATSWQKDEYAGYGSYTNFKTHIGGKAGENGPMIDDGVRAMRAGVPERGLWFAGEHTAPFVTLGTSTGAYCSGEIVARRIVEAHSGKTSKTQPTDSI